MKHPWTSPQGFLWEYPSRLMNAELVRITNLLYPEETVESVQVQTDVNLDDLIGERNG